MKVTIRFEWCAAHRLINHAGLCRNLHGHNYVALVDIDGWIGADAMVVDFDDAKRAIGDWIAANWDHAYLHQYGDSIAEVIGEGHRKFGFRTPPTAEAIAVELKVVVGRWIDQMRADKKVPSVTRPGCVRVWETPDYCAEA